MKRVSYTTKDGRRFEAELEHYEDRRDALAQLAEMAGEDMSEYWASRSKSLGVSTWWQCPDGHGMRYRLPEIMPDACEECGKDLAMHHDELEPGSIVVTQ